MVHPVHGRIELTTAPPFTGDRFVQAAVRAYRASLAESVRLSFGFDVLDVGLKLIAAARIRELGRVGEHDAAVHPMRDAERQPATVRRQRAGDDAVTDV